MGETTGISWTDHTHNWWRGCAHATDAQGNPHPGCDHCYAESMAKRNPSLLGRWGADGVRVLGAPAYLQQPLKWNAAAGDAGERQRVFALSLGDVFEHWQGPVNDHLGNSLPKTLDDLRGDLFAVIDRTRMLDWLLLTKRPGNVLRMWPRRQDVRYIPEAGSMNDHGLHHRENVWLLTSVSNQTTADDLAPQLLECVDLCPVLGLSAEPLLGPINLARWLNVDWVIIGVESNGHKVGRLSTDPTVNESDWLDWAREIVSQCRAAGVAVWVKQIPLNGRLVKDIAQFPPDLRFQEFPESGIVA